MLTPSNKISIEELRVLLEKEDVRLKLRKIVDHLFNFSLFIQKTQFKKRTENFQVNLWIFTQSLLNFINFIDIPKHCMIHNEVVQPSCLFLSLLKLNTIIFTTDFEYFIPFFKKLNSVQKSIILYASLRLKHCRVSPNSDLQIYLAHFPFELLFIEIGDILRN